MDGAVRHLVSNYSPKGSRVGWLMMASILVEPGSLFDRLRAHLHREQFHPDPLLLGLAAAGRRRRADRGAHRGWLSDLIGRRIMFLATMVMFIVLALLQAFVTSVEWLVVVRLLLGVPLAATSRPDTPTSWRRCQGRARDHGQSLAIHVRNRRGDDAGGHRGLHRLGPHAGADLRVTLASAPFPPSSSW